jgi:hypothetical protein
VRLPVDFRYPRFGFKGDVALEMIIRSFLTAGIQAVRGNAYGVVRAGEMKAVVSKPQRCLVSGSQKVRISSDPFYYLTKMRFDRWYAMV